MEISVNYTAVDLPSPAAHSETPENPKAAAKAVPMQPEKHTLGDVLASFGFAPTEENLKLVSLLLENQLPVNESNMRRLNQALKLLNADSGKAIFFVANELRINGKNAEMLNELLGRNSNISEAIKALAQSIASLSDPVLKNAALRALFGGSEGLGKVYESIPSNTPDAVRLNQAQAQPQTNTPQTVPLGSGAQGNPPAPGTGAPLPAQTGPDQPQALAQTGPLSLDTEISQLSRNFQTGPDQATDQTGQPPRSGPDQTNETTAAASSKEMGSNMPENAAQVSTSGSVAKREIFGSMAEEEIEKTAAGRSRSGSARQAAEPGEAAGILKDAGPEAKAIVNKLHIDAAKSDVKAMNKFYGDMYESLDRVSRELARAQTPEAGEALREVQRVQEKLEFIAQLKHDIFLQIPLQIQDRPMNGELYVFKDSRRKKTGGDSASALIALDTAALGRFEAYLQKNSRNIVCQFRLEDEKVEKLVRQHIGLLAGKLAEHNFTLGAYSFCRQEDAFTVTAREPGAESLLPEPDGLAFDLRV
ncbi:MAG: hypothetical protein LBS62_13220 [Clostridiales bacterium]|nr:hypothetical protein [Clostridiales bacterium]